MIKPYFETARGKLYHSDCLEILPQLTEKVDLVLTDPPYGIGESSGTKGKERTHKHSYIGFEDNIKYVQNICVPAIKICLKFPCIILTPGLKAITFYPQPDGFGVLYQPATCGMDKFGRADAQPVFYYGRNKKNGKTITFNSFVNNERPSCQEHPCSKPIKIWKKLILKVTDNNDLILDPFSGSGTTGVAAEDLNRRWICIEKEEKYCELSAKRIEEFLKQGRLF